MRNETIYWDDLTEVTYLKQFKITEYDESFNFLFSAIFDFWILP